MELHLHLRLLDLSAERTQSRFVLIRRIHAHELLPEPRRHTTPELCSTSQIQIAMPLVELPLQAAQLLIRALTHPDQHAAAAIIATNKLIDRTSHRTPPTQAEEANTKIGPPGLLQRFQQSINQLLVDVVEDLAGSLYRGHIRALLLSDNRFYGNYTICLTRVTGAGDD